MRRAWVHLICLLFTTAWGFEAPGAESQHHGFAGDATAAYSWGTYASPGLAEDAHAGMAVQLFTGYRLRPDIEVGLTAAWSFPQISVANSREDAAFSRQGFGIAAGYLWRRKVEPFLEYLPIVRLSQSTSSRLATSVVTSDLAYEGSSYGGGAKIYLTERNARAVQVGLRFAYSHERYGVSSVSSRIEPLPDHANPAFAPHASEKTGDRILSGDSYRFGLFIGY